MQADVRRARRLREEALCRRSAGLQLAGIEGGEAVLDLYGVYAWKDPGKGRSGSARLPPTPRAWHGRGRGLKKAWRHGLLLKACGFLESWWHGFQACGFLVAWLKKLESIGVAEMDGPSCNVPGVQACAVHSSRKVPVLQRLSIALPSPAQALA